MATKLPVDFRNLRAAFATYNVLNTSIFLFFNKRHRALMNCHDDMKCCKFLFCFMSNSKIMLG
jgi:hypothetical protein